MKVYKVILTNSEEKEVFVLGDSIAEVVTKIQKYLQYQAVPTDERQEIRGIAEMCELTDF
jgi:hypothetical protein